VRYRACTDDGHPRGAAPWRKTGWVDVTDPDADPLHQLSTWLDAARAAGQPMPDAMTIATATRDAVPSARMAAVPAQPAHLGRSRVQATADSHVRSLLLESERTGRANPALTDRGLRAAPRHAATA